MKKKILFTMFILLIFVPSFSFASVKLVYDGKVHIYNEKPITIIINEKEIQPPVAPVLLQGTTLVPARAIFQEMGAEVKWEPKAKKVIITTEEQEIVLVVNDTKAIVDGKEELMEKPAKIINGSTMIPIRFISEQIGMNVEWNKEKFLIQITKKEKQVTSDSLKVESISWERIDNNLRVKIQANSKFTTYNKFELKNPTRVVIDIADADLALHQHSFQVNDAKLSKIRTSLFQEDPKTTRVVLDLPNSLPCGVQLSNDKTVMYVTIGESGDALINEEKQGNTSDSNIILNNVNELNKKLGYNTITIEDGTDRIGVIIKMKENQDYKVYRITAEDVIVLEIEDSEFDNNLNKINIGNSVINKITSENLQEDTGLLKFYTAFQAQYQVIEEPQALAVYISKTENKNIRYENSRFVSTLIFSNSDVTKVPEVIQKDSEFIIKLPDGTVELEQGALAINDALAEWLEIVDSNTVELKLNDSENISFNIRNDNKNKIFIYLYAKSKMPVQSDNILIAIDPGHGGKDPGTVYKKQVQEKDLNLDIAKRLDDALRDFGIPTILTRSTDEFVELKARTTLANNMKATLFVSIHNNCSDSLAVSGTETLYFPYDDGKNGLTSKRFAELVQADILSYINTKDRKTVSRPNLVVLNSTQMPAVLVEVGFVSNESDRRRLSTEEFRQNAAEGICSGILKALGEINFD